MPADSGEDDEDPVIRAERDHLIRSREYLGIMREDVLAITPMAGDPVSLEFLKADLWRRAESLKDIPDAPLFFGRLDYSELATTDQDFAGAGRGVRGVVPPREHCTSGAATCTTRTARRSTCSPTYPPSSSRSSPVGVTPASARVSRVRCAWSA